MRPRRFGVVLLVVVLLAATGGSALADGFGSRLWPWGHDNASSQRRQKKKKSPLARAVQAPKNLVTNTWDFVTPPYGKQPEKDPLNGAHRFMRPDLAHREEEKKPGFFRRMFQAEEEPHKPLSVDEWIAQDRPGFDRR